MDTIETRDDVESKHTFSEDEDFIESKLFNLTTLPGLSDPDHDKL